LNNRNTWTSPLLSYSFPIKKKCTGDYAAISFHFLYSRERKNKGKRLMNNRWYWKEKEVLQM